ncbi:MAG: type II toxin-antitoxin system VapC family toxin [Deltaproteobacteria bacterium]|nr:type II toxin-antitoxin system VapC family toxin [Deltaproteobacteria bacterium]
MVLVDTSVWIDHLRNNNAALRGLLLDGRVICHEFIIGELACGNLKNRKEILSLLGEMPRATSSDHEEVLSFLESHRLYGKGIGWIDAHLLVSTKLSYAKIWTTDKKLAALSHAHEIAFSS